MQRQKALLDAPIYPGDKLLNQRQPRLLRFAEGILSFWRNTGAPSLYLLLYSHLHLHCKPPEVTQNKIPFFSISQSPGTTLPPPPSPTASVFFHSPSCGWRFFLKRWFKGQWKLLDFRVQSQILRICQGNTHKTARGTAQDGKGSQTLWLRHTPCQAWPLLDLKS